MGLFSRYQMLGLVFTVVSVANAAPSKLSLDHQCSAQVRELYQSSEIGSWYENIAIRSNGQILASRIDIPAVDSFNPFETGSTPSRIATFPVDSMLGVIEYSPDVFAVAGGNRSGPGTYSLFQLDLTGTSATTQILAAGPNNASFNGLTYLASANTFLAADPYQGIVWGYSMDSREWFVASSSALLAPSAYVPFGVNGIRLLPARTFATTAEAKRDHVDLYFTNTARGAFGYLPISTTSGKQVGHGAYLAYDTVPGSSPPTVNTSITSFDDFTFAPSSNKKHFAYLATNYGNTIDRVALTKDGRKVPAQNGANLPVIAGHKQSTQIAGATAAAFGRTSVDAETLYVVTSGDLEGPVNGTIVVGAQILALDLTQC